MRGPERLFGACAGAFAVAAVVAAATRAATPFAHGWWLVAYLLLVGGVAQVLLGPGLLALVERGAACGPGRAMWSTELLLWNAGTVLVAVAELAGDAPGVLAGSVLLLVALGSFASSLRTATATADRPLAPWSLVYVVLLAFLAISVFTGAGLAGALPAQ